MMQRREFVKHGLAAGAALTISPWMSFAEDKPKAKMLMLTQSAGFKHGSVSRKGTDLSPSEIAITQLGQQTGLYTVHCTQDAAADFTKANLQNYDIVFFYTTGNLPIKREDLDYFFKEWLPAKGHGFLGAHSSSDTYHNEQLYWDMIGGTFNGHPWNAGETVTVAIHDQKFPAMIPFGAEFQIKDEIYQYKNWQPEKVHVLASLDMSKCKTKAPYHVPVAWAKEYGAGRVFYNNMGHNPETWANPTVVKSWEAAIRWVMGLEQADVTPNPEVSKAEEEKAKAAAK